MGECKMKCVKCSHEQVSGKFCGKCGTPLQVAETTAVEEVLVVEPGKETVSTAESASVTQSNEQVERVKETSKKYIAYLKEFAVNPSQIFTNPENQFTNALITLTIVLLLASYTVFSAVKGFVSSIVGGIAGSMFGEGVGSGIGDILGSQVPKISLFPTFGNAFMVFVLLVGLSVVISWAVMKISKQPLNLKQLVGIYGTLLIPVIGVLVLSILLILMKNLALGVGLLILGFLFAVYLYPLRIVFRNFGGELKIDAIHRGLMYFGGFSIVIYIITSQYINNKVGPIKDIIGGLMNEFF